MKSTKRTMVCVGIGLSLLGVIPARAQNAAPSPKMSFFVTSVGLGKGGDLGGLAGADKHCQDLAQSAGAGGRTWRAYLSTSATDGQKSVNARDRIGAGPWYSFKGVQVAANLSELHGDTLEQARLGNAVTRLTALTEKGDRIVGAGDPGDRHDMLTGSQPDGTAFTDKADHTCKNWMSSTDGSAQVGHHDRTGGTNTSWNSAHASLGCGEESFLKDHNEGLFYCFAADSP